MKTTWYWRVKWLLIQLILLGLTVLAVKWALPCWMLFVVSAAYGSVAGWYISTLLRELTGYPDRRNDDHS